MENNKNVLARLQEVRAELCKVEMKKSGKNSFAKFSYFQLDDFIPEVMQLCNKHGITPIVNIVSKQLGENFVKMAQMTVYNVDDKEDHIVFEVPFVVPEIRGAVNIQNLGGALTYYRRYLYLLALEIVEPDTFDALSDEDKQPVKPKKVTTKKEVKDDTDEKNKLIEKIKANAQNEDVKRAIMGAITKEKAKSFNDLSLASLKEIAKELE